MLPFGAISQRATINNLTAWNKVSLQPVRKGGKKKTESGELQKSDQITKNNPKLHTMWSPNNGAKH